MRHNYYEPILFRAPQHVFVYGTLKKGFSNNRIFQDFTKAMYCGTYFTKAAAFQMYSFGGFPAVKAISEGETGNSIRGEVYLVTPEILERVDTLEGHPSWYKRRRVLLDDGTWAFMYVMPEDYINEKDPLVELTLSTDGQNYQEWIGSTLPKVVPLVPAKKELDK